jgi:2-amino-4-hydroxy-6-hydroxymethyldihydropteridine diphosphokinase
VLTPPRGERVALCLGSNSRDSESQLLTALDRLSAALSVEFIASPYRTPAVSPIAQPDYLNTALVGTSALEPDELLALAKALERSAGRRPGPRFGPRPLDIDLVVWGSRELAHPELTLPHPRIRERAFFLAPLAEIAPELSVPPDDRSIGELLAAVDTTGIERRTWSREPPAGG